MSTVIGVLAVFGAIFIVGLLSAAAIVITGEVSARRWRRRQARGAALLPPREVLRDGKPLSEGERATLAALAGELNDCCYEGDEDL